MNILFDGVFNCNPKSGIHRYFYNLIKNLPDKFHKYSSTTESDSCILNHYTPYLRHFRPHKLSFALEYFWFRTKSLTVDFNLVHSAFYNLSHSCRYLQNRGIPHIITVHDLIHELFDREDAHIRKTRKNILQNAKAIISVSHNTKNDLLNIYPSIKEENVFVIHHGYHNDGVHVSKNTTKKQSFLLYVGHREGYKNFKILLPTLQELRKKYSIELLVVGQKPSAVENKMIRMHKLESHIQFLGKIADKELNKLYSQCLAFLYPSLYEGFGYPIIESMTNGAIPIVSNTSCMPEIVGDGGILVTPNCSNSIVKAVCKVIEDKSFSRSLMDSVIERSKVFSMEKNVKDTIKVYEMCSSNEI